MKSCYVVRTESDWEVEDFFEKMDDSLRSGKGFVLSGAVREAAKGYYVVGMETMAGLFIGPTMLIILGMLVWVMWELLTLSNWLTGIGVFLLTWMILLMSPGVQVLLMRLGLRKKTGRWVKVERATTDLLWRTAHGKV